MYVFATRMDCGWYASRLGRSIRVMNSQLFGSVVLMNLMFAMEEGREPESMPWPVEDVWVMEAADVAAMERLQ